MIKHQSTLLSTAGWSEILTGIDTLRYSFRRSGNAVLPYISQAVLNHSKLTAELTVSQLVKKFPSIL